MVAFNCPISVAVVINLYVEYFGIVMENLHHVNWYIFPLPHLVQRIVVINGNSSLGIWSRTLLMADEFVKNLPSVPFCVNLMR